ncbi:MAG TPA: ABC transporter ATP-binding protein [Allosphingosinicella sp.]|nr:ABC transporter ATP-binding protein [Allosphingosinicella sp.]
MTPLLATTSLALPGRLQATDFTIERPQLVCMVGPNGSGKTSLLHALAGIGGPDGSVFIEGTDRDLASPQERRRLLSFLPAAREAAWPLSVRDLVRLGLPAGASGRGADAALAALQLEAFADRRIDRLSTGERSRVLIARALAPQPRLLLLDEPVANLDPLWQLRLMDLLRGLAREGQAVVLALHDLDLAARYADRLIVMDGGRIVGDGDPRALIGGAQVRAVFGIEMTDGVWRPV